MPKRPAAPTAAIEVNPQFAARKGVEVIETAGSTKSLKELVAIAQPLDTRPSSFSDPETVARVNVASQLADLSELLHNAILSHPRAGGVLTDGLGRIATLRKTLGL